VKPASRNIDETRFDVGASIPLITSGVAIGRSSAPICDPAAAGTPMLWTSAGRSANAATRAYAARIAAASVSGVTGRSIRACADAARRAPVSAVASIISPIGVMPAIGSLGNAPIE
jgi:hypothetical protein